MGDVGAPWPPLECTLSLASCRLRAESLARRLHSKLWAPGGSSFEASFHAAAARRRCGGGESASNTASTAKANPYLLRGYGASGGLVNGHWGGQRRVDGDCFRPLDESDEEEIVVSPPGRTSGVAGEMGGVLTAVLRGKMPVEEEEEEEFSDASSDTLSENDGYEGGRLYRGCSYETGLDKLGLTNEEDDLGLTNVTDRPDERVMLEVLTNGASGQKWTNGECDVEGDDEEEEEDEEELDRVLEKAIKFGVPSGGASEGCEASLIIGICGAKGVGDGEGQGRKVEFVDVDESSEDEVGENAMRETVREDGSESEDGETEEETEEEEEDEEMEGRRSVIENSRFYSVKEVSDVPNVVKNTGEGTEDWLVRCNQIKSTYGEDTEDEGVELNDPVEDDLDQSFASNDHVDSKVEIPEELSKHDLGPVTSNDIVADKEESESEEEETEEEISDEEDVTEEESEEEVSAHEEVQNEIVEVINKLKISEPERDESDTESEDEQGVQNEIVEVIKNTKGSEPATDDSDTESEADQGVQNEIAEVINNSKVSEPASDDSDTESEAEQGVQIEDVQETTTKEFIRFRESNSDDEENSEDEEHAAISDKFSFEEVNAVVVDINKNVQKVFANTTLESCHDEGHEQQDSTPTNETGTFVKFRTSDSDDEEEEFEDSSQKERQASSWDHHDGENETNDIVNTNQKYIKFRMTDSDEEDEIEGALGENSNATGCESVKESDGSLQKNFIKFRLTDSDEEEDIGDDFSVSPERVNDDDDHLSDQETQKQDDATCKSSVPIDSEDVGFDENDDRSEQEDVVVNKNFVKFRLDCCDYDEEVGETSAVDKKDYIRFTIPESDDKKCEGDGEKNVIFKDGFVRFRMDSCDDEEDFSATDEVKNVATKQFVRFRSDSCDIDDEEKQSVSAIESCTQFSQDLDDKEEAQQDIALADRAIAKTNFIKFRSDSCDAEDEQLENSDDEQCDDDIEDIEEDEVDELEDEDRVLNEVIGSLSIGSDEEIDEDNETDQQNETFPTQTPVVSRFKFQVTPVSEEAHLEGLMNDHEWLQARSGLRQRSSLTDEDSDEGELSLSRRILLRTTSLKTGKTPPGTPRRKKIVRFADALGLDLEAVRHIVSDDIPTVPASAFYDLQLEPILPSPSISAPVCLARRCLYPQFSQPVTEPRFVERIRTNKVCLENVVVTSMGLYGVVRVLNYCFHKSVTVRYTTDDWVTKLDMPALYVEGSSDGFSDRFRFTLHVPHLPAGDRLVLAIRFRAEDGDFWDNNAGLNYVLRCLELTSLSGDPDIQPDDGHISFV